MKFRSALAVTSFMLAACGSSGAAPDAGRDASVEAPAESCVQRGDVGNDRGIGTFCTPRGSECAEFPQAGLCLAQVAPAEGQWFCTRTCTSDAQCGEGALCDGDARGRACIPARCLADRPDAGAGTDAGADTDAGA